MPIPVPLETLAITSLSVPVILSQMYGELHRYPGTWDLARPTTQHSAVPVAVVGSPQRPRLSCRGPIRGAACSLQCSWAAHRFGPQAPKPRPAFPRVRCPYNVSRQLPCARQPPGARPVLLRTEQSASGPQAGYLPSPRMPSRGPLKERRAHKPMFKTFSLSGLLLFSHSTSNYCSWIVGSGCAHCPSPVFSRFMMSSHVPLWTVSAVNEKW